MAGISPNGAGARPVRAMPDALALELVASRVQHELRRERAAGANLKAAYHAVARRLGLHPRRVRAFHHREVAADDVRAAELLAADARYRAELAALLARLETIRGLIGAEAMGNPLGDPPAGAMAGARGACGREGRGLVLDPGLAAAEMSEGDGHGQ